MARETGTFDFSANFETKIKGTIDARQLVDDFADLLAFDETNYIPNGFFVAVKGTSDPNERGIYQCIDEDNLDQAASWEKVSADLSAFDPELQRDVDTNVTVGGSEANTTIPQGMTFTEYVELVHQRTFEPTFTNPSFGLSRGATGFYKIGGTAAFNLTFSFNRGSIVGADDNGVWNPALVQDFRAGAADTYTIDGTTQAGNVLAMSETVVAGIMSFEATVDYLVGPQPVDSNGDDFDSPYPAGTSPIQTATIEGVYPLFATTSAINTATEQALVSMLNANNIELDLVAESGGNKQFFEVPTDWINARALTSVQYYNSFSGQWDTDNKLSDFDVTDVTETVEGNSVNYKKYTYNGLSRGAIKIRLIF